MRKHAQLHRIRFLKWNQTEAGRFEKAHSTPSLPPSPHTDSTRPLCTFSVFYLCRCFLLTVTCSFSTFPKDNIFFYFKVENTIFHLRDFQESSASYPLLPVGITWGAFVGCCPNWVSSQLSQKPAPHCTLSHSAHCFFSAGTLRWWPVEKWPFPPKVPCDRDPEKVGRWGVRCRRWHAGLK